MLTWYMPNLGETQLVNWCPKPNFHNMIQFLAGWWLSHPSETYYESIGMIICSIYGKIKNVPNHQPVRVHTQWKKHETSPHRQAWELWTLRDSSAWARVLPAAGLSFARNDCRSFHGSLWRPGRSSCHSLRWDNDDHWWSSIIAWSLGPRFLWRKPYVFLFWFQVAGYIFRMIPWSCIFSCGCHKPRKRETEWRSVFHCSSHDPTLLIVLSTSEKRCSAWIRPGDQNLATKSEPPKNRTRKWIFTIFGGSSLILS